MFSSLTQRKSCRMMTVVVCAWLVAAPGRAETEGDLAALEKLVGQWVELRGEIASEKREWVEAHALLAQEKDLLVAEKKMLLDENRDLRERSDRLQEEQAAVTSKRDELQKALNELPTDLLRAEQDLRALKKRVPASLLYSLESLFARLPAEDADPVPLSVSSRAQVAVALYTQIETLQSTVHVVRQALRVGDGPSREYDVVYIGLARGFAVTSDNRVAAVGSPSESGWTWKRRDKIAGAIRRAITIARREVPAELVELPLEAKGAKSQALSGKREE